MIYGMWQSVAGLQSQEYLQAVVANNLANVQTPGFKPDRAIFQERLNAATQSGAIQTRHPVLDALSGGLRELPIYTDFAKAAATPSGNPLDVMVDGEGFLAVQTTQGVRYTRDGRLAVGDDGTLIHVASGHPVLDESGQTIFVDQARGGDFKIDQRGRITQGKTVIGTLAVRSFDEPQRLEKAGENLFDAGRQRARPAESTLRGGVYEASGVDPVKTLVEMIAASRAYESNARMISLQDETLQRVVNDVGRIG